MIAFPLSKLIEGAFSRLPGEKKTYVYMGHDLFIRISNHSLGNISAVIGRAVLQHARSQLAIWLIYHTFPYKRLLCKKHFIGVFS